MLNPMSVHLLTRHGLCNEVSPSGRLCIEHGDHAGLSHMDDLGFEWLGEPIGGTYESCSPYEMAQAS